MSAKVLLTMQGHARRCQRNCLQAPMARRSLRGAATSQFLGRDDRRVDSPIENALDMLALTFPDGSTLAAGSEARAYGMASERRPAAAHIHRSLRARLVPVAFSARRAHSRISRRRCGFQLWSVETGLQMPALTVTRHRYINSSVRMASNCFPQATTAQSESGRARAASHTDCSSRDGSIRRR